MFKRAISTAASAGLTPLAYENTLYATLKVYGRSYLVTKGDVINLPFRMHNTQVGDKIHFNKIDTLGSRNFTYHIANGIDPALVKLSGVVIEKSKSPLTTKEVTKRRNRHVKHSTSKHDLTMIRISELELL